MAFITGPERHGRRWRIRIDYGRKRSPRSGTRREDYYFATEALARKKKRAFEAELYRADTIVDQVVGRYLEAMKLDGRTASHIDRTRNRLRNMLAPILYEPVHRLTKSKAARLYGEMRERPTRRGLPPSADEQLNTLAQTKTFGRWCTDEGVLSVNPFEQVRGRGRRKRGKPQLTRDEAAVYVEACLVLGPEEAVAAMLPLLCGLSASEVTDRLVRDIDAGGSIIRITQGKTSNRCRDLELPQLLRPLVADLTADKASTEPLFPGRDRHWLGRVVRRVCAQAELPTVTPHGLRGTSGTLARQGGVAAHAIVAHLGHGSYEVTKRHYLSPGTEEAAEQRQRLRVIDGGLAIGGTK